MFQIETRAENGMICSEPLLPEKQTAHLDFISALPEPLLLKVFSKLDISTLLKCSQVLFKYFDDS